MTNDERAVRDYAGFRGKRANNPLSAPLGKQRRLLPALSRFTIRSDDCHTPLSNSFGRGPSTIAWIDFALNGLPRSLR